MQNGSAALTRTQHRIAAAGGRHIGDLITWNCERIDVPRGDARDVFAMEGYGGFIPDMDPAAALSRAAAEVGRAPGILVRPFAHPKGDTSAAIAVYVQRACDGEAGDNYDCGARCRVDATTGTVLALSPDGAPAIDLALSHAEAVASHANHLIGSCGTKDISSAMVATVKALSGVPLRDRGGFYLLPPSSCAVWSRLKLGLERLGVQPIRIEMHDAPDNVAVAQAAAKGALEADIGELMLDLEKASSEGMRQHALVRRVQLCKELVAKADLYRGVLAGVTDQITGRVETMRKQFELHLDGGGAFDVAVNE